MTALTAPRPRMPLESPIRPVRILDLYQPNRGGPKAGKKACGKTAQGQPAAGERPDRPPAGGSFGIVLEPGEQQMVLPDAVDAEVLARITLARKAAALEQANGRCIGRDAGGLDPVQPQRPERERQHGLDGRGHVATAHEERAHPVAEAPGLRDAAPDAREREAADQDIILLAEHEERVGLIRPPVLRVALETTPVGAAGE